MSVEAEAIRGAAYGQRTEERVNSRNGYRHREWDTRIGTIDLAAPKLRHRSYFCGLPGRLNTHVLVRIRSSAEVKVAVPGELERAWAEVP